MDLYKTYKLMKQRAKRRPHDIVSQELCKTARTIFYVDGKKQEILRTISTIKSLEERLPSGLKRYGMEMQCAVNGGLYSIDRPYTVRHRFEEGNKAGLIYVLTSPSRVGQSKLGATWQSMQQRRASYQSKYQYSVRAENWAEVEKPFGLEDKVARKIIAHRVTGNTSGDSIEWYYLSPEKLWDIVLETYAERDH
jgi:hypothetical protein